MEYLLLALVALLLEGLGEFLVEVLFGLIVEAMAERWEKGSRTIPWILLALLGATSGFLSAAIFPHRRRARATRPPANPARTIRTKSVAIPIRQD